MLDTTKFVVFLRRVVIEDLWAICRVRLRAEGVDWSLRSTSCQANPLAWPPFAGAPTKAQYVGLTRVVEITKLCQVLDGP